MTGQNPAPGPCQVEIGMPRPRVTGQWGVGCLSRLGTLTAWHAFRFPDHWVVPGEWTRGLQAGRTTSTGILLKTRGLLVVLYAQGHMDLFRYLSVHCPRAGQQVSLSGGDSVFWDPPVSREQSCHDEAGLGGGSQERSESQKGKRKVSGPWHLNGGSR